MPFEWRTEGRIAAAADGGVHRSAVGSVRRAPLRELTSRSVRAVAVVCARARGLLPVAGAADRRRDRRLHQPGRGHPPARRRRQQGGRLRHRLDLRHHSCRLLVHGAAAVRRPLQARRRPRPGDRLSLFRSGDQHPRHRADGEGAGLRAGRGAGDRRCFFLGDHRLASWRSSIAAKSGNATARPLAERWCCRRMASPFRPARSPPCSR